MDEFISCSTFPSKSNESRGEGGTKGTWIKDQVTKCYADIFWYILDGCDAAFNIRTDTVLFVQIIIFSVYFWEKLHSNIKHNVILASVGTLCNMQSYLISMSFHLRRFWHYCPLAKHTFMIASSHGNIFRVTGLCTANLPVTGEFP